MSLQLTSVTIYPVKSTAGMTLPHVRVEPFGLADDRRWMLVDSDGECVTARRDRALLSIVATPTATGLRLHRDPPSGRLAIEVPVPTGPSVEVSVHGRPLRGIPADAQVSAWVGAQIARPDVRLVHLARPRPLNPAHSRAGDATAFADGYPVTLTSAASLRRLQDWITQTALERGEEPADIPMQRFRANLVVDGDLDAFAEDHWRTVRIGAVDFDIAKPIDRCVMTTIDPVTLESGHEPIRSLARHHAWDGNTWFGIQLIPRTDGTISIGDAVTAVDQRSDATAAS